MLRGALAVTHEIRCCACGGSQPPTTTPRPRRVSEARARLACSPCPHGAAGLLLSSETSRRRGGRHLPRNAASGDMQDSSRAARPRRGKHGRWPDFDSFQAHLEGTKTLGMIWTFSRIKRTSPALHACRPTKGAVQHKAVAVASAQGSPAGMLPALGLRHVPSSSNRPSPNGLLLLPCLTEVLFDLP